jgi:hypothetical protein
MGVNWEVSSPLFLPIFYSFGEEKDGREMQCGFFIRLL